MVLLLPPILALPVNQPISWPQVILAHHVELEIVKLVLPLMFVLLALPIIGFQQQAPVLQPLQDVRLKLRPPPAMLVKLTISLLLIRLPVLSVIILALPVLLQVLLTAYHAKVIRSIAPQLKLAQFPLNVLLFITMYASYVIQDISLVLITPVLHALPVPFLAQFLIPDICK